MTLYYPQKAERAKEIKLILFLKSNCFSIDTIIFSYPNSGFEHGDLIKSLLKDYPNLKSLFNIKIKKHEMIYEIADRLSAKGIATFCNNSIDALDICSMILPYVLENDQIENILSFQNLYDCYKYKMDISQKQFDHEQKPLCFSSNEEFYAFLSSLKRVSIKQKKKISNVSV